MSESNMEKKEKLKSMFSNFIDNAADMTVEPIPAALAMNLASAEAQPEPIPEITARGLHGRFDTLMQQTCNKAEGEYSKGVWANWTELRDPINALNKYNSSEFSDIDLFGFYMAFGVVNEELGEKLLSALKIEEPGLYQIYFDEHKNDATIVQQEYIGRMTIFVHLSYCGKLIEDKKYSKPLASGGSAKIPTIYDVGRLCPPKCPPRYNISTPTN